MKPIDDPNRWRRRRRTIPAMLGGAVVAFGTAPLTLPLAAVLDLARGRRRLPTARTGIFALRYLANDAVEIVLAPGLWIGRRLGRGDAGYRWVQRWSIRTLASAGDRWLGIRIDGKATVLVESGSGPLIVLCRHTSVLDSSLPSLLFGLDTPWRVRSIVTDDALNDPGFDLIYPSLGTVFIDRDEGASARRVIHGFRRHDGPDDVVTIYPEGRIFSAAGRDRSLERLGERDPLRSARLAGLRHLLPPRPGGVLSLLDALPNADVVVIGHIGFESVPSMRAMLDVAPVDRTVTVTATRIARADIPETDPERTVWLDQLWLDLDQWVETRTATSVDISI